MSRSLHTPIYKELRRILTEARSAAGLTQAQVAQRLGRPQSFMSKWEGAERHLDVTEFFGLCEAIGISASDVFKAIEQRTPLHGSALFR